MRNQVTGSHDRTIKIWDLNTGYTTKTLLCFSSCNDVVTTVDGNAILSAHFDGNLRQWDMHTGPACVPP